MVERHYEEVPIGGVRHGVESKGASGGKSIGVLDGERNGQVQDRAPA
jgi:hypothetical protein